MKTAIYGAGATGGALGVLIRESGGEADLYTRNAAHVSAVREWGLTLRCAADGVSFTHRVPMYFPEELLSRGEKYDVIFLMTKQRGNAETARFLKGCLTQNGVVVTTQNGLPERVIAEEIGKERTFGCVCSFGANFETAGEAILTSSLASAKTCVGAYLAGERSDFTAAAMKNIRAVLQPISAVTGGEFYRETDNLCGVRYSKLVLNAAFSGLSVATGMTFGQIAKYGKTKKIALAVMRETLAVAQGAGVVTEKIQGRDIGAYLKKGGVFKEAFLRIALPYFVKTHKNSVSGMLLDLRRGRRCEIDFITGAVSAEGKRVGVKTPYCDAITALVHGIEEGRYETGKENAAFLSRSEMIFD